MQQFTKTVRLKITPEMSDQLKALKRLSINPTKFMRIAIQDRLDRTDKGRGVRYDYILKHYLYISYI